MSSRNEEFRMSHRPPDPRDDVGAPMHDMNEVMPDVAEHPEYYTFHGPDIDGPSIRAIQRAKGNPDQPTWMYRAMPKSAIEQAVAEGRHPISAGDWVTPSKPYAKQHLLGRAEETGTRVKDWGIAAKRVRARHLWSQGDDLNEFGYAPDEEER